MKLTTVWSTLAEIPICKTMLPHQVTRLALAMETAEYRADTVIFEEGALANVGESRQERLHVEKRVGRAGQGLERPAVACHRACQWLASALHFREDEGTAQHLRYGQS